MKLTRLAAAARGLVTFRVNSGRAWTGDIIRKLPDGSILIKNPRPFRTGVPKGTPDLLGWSSIPITETMLGRTVAVFCAIETKSPTGRATPEQENFLNQVRAAGGIAILVREPNDVHRGVSSWITQT